MVKRLPLSCGGFMTLAEVLVLGSAVAAAGLYIAQFLNKPAAIEKMMAAEDGQRDLGRALGMIVNDLREADPSSIDWNSLPPLAQNFTGFSFGKTNYDLVNPGSVSTTTVQYVFQSSPDPSIGSLVRLEGAAQTLVIDHLQAPGADAPLVQGDPDASHVLTITLWSRPPNQPPVRVVRRVAIRG